MSASSAAKSQKKLNKQKRAHPTAADALIPPAIAAQLGRWQVGLGLSAIYVLILLTAAHFLHRVGDYGVETDFFWSYAPDARAIQEMLKGNGGAFPIDAFRGPAYPVALSLFAFVIPDFFAAGVIFGICCAGATLFLTHRLVAEFFGKAEAFFALLMLATNSVFIQYSYSAGTDMFFNLIATAAVYACLKALNGEGIYWLCAAGVLTGVALLTRQNALFIVVGFLTSLALFNPSNRSAQSRLLDGAILVGLAFAVYSPYGFFTLHEKGQFFYSKNYLNIAKDLFGRETNWDAFWFKKAEEFTSLGDVVFADPAKFFTNTLANIPAHFIGDLGELLTWFIGIFAALGIIAVLVQRNLTAVQAAYFIFAALHFGVLLLIFYGARFSLNLLAPYSVLALLFFSWKIVPRAIAVALPLALAVALFQSVQFHRKNIDSGPQEMLALREKFFEVTSRNAKEHFKETIIARKPHIAHYLNLEMGGFPLVETYDELIAEARKQQATYLYYSYFEANLRPQFRFLFNVNQPPPDLEPILTLQNPPAVLYRIKPKK